MIKKEIINIILICNTMLFWPCMAIILEIMEYKEKKERMKYYEKARNKNK